MVDQRVNGFDFMQFVFDFVIGWDVFYWVRVIECYECDDIFDIGGFYVFECVYYVCGFYLEYGDGFGCGVEFIGGFVIQWDGVDFVYCVFGWIVELDIFGGYMDVLVGFFDKFDGVFYDGQGFQI